MKPASVFIASLLLALSACVPCVPRRPPPRAGENVIAVYSDSQRNHRAHRRVVEGILSFSPSAVFHAGDLVDNGESANDWEEFNEITRELRARAAFYPTLGNHEKNSPRYFENFELPGNERWYSVRRGPMAFFVLDSESALGPDSQQFAWLKERLATSDAPFKIVVLHRPLFSSTDEGGEAPLRRHLHPLFKQHGVELVFSGHHHNYERSTVDGIQYVITGGGGGYLDGPDRENPYRKAFRKKYHFCILREDGKGVLNVAAYDLDGCEFDRFEVRRKAGRSR